MLPSKADLLLDLLVKREHRHFYQGFIHYTHELYAGSPSYLISAGGKPEDYAYPIDLSRPLGPLRFLGDPPVLSDLRQRLERLLMARFGKEDLGLTQSTTLMPTRWGTSRNDLLRFEGDADDVPIERRRWNLCVAPDFACGARLVIPRAYAGCRKSPPDEAYWRDRPEWTFYDTSQPGCEARSDSSNYYLAVYKSRDDTGFFEAYDKLRDATRSFEQFVRAVKDNNPNLRYDAYSSTYVTTTGVGLTSGSTRTVRSWIFIPRCRGQRGLWRLGMS